MGYGCANPDWGEKADTNYKIERREKWRKGGHTHRPAIDVKNGITQIVSGHNATGYFIDINIESISYSGSGDR